MNKWRMVTRDEAVKLFFEEEKRNIFQVDVNEVAITNIEDMQLLYMEKENEDLFYVMLEKEE